MKSISVRQTVWITTTLAFLCSCGSTGTRSSGSSVQAAVEPVAEQEKTFQEDSESKQTKVRVKKVATEAAARQNPMSTSNQATLNDLKLTLTNQFGSSSLGSLKICFGPEKPVAEYDRGAGCVLHFASADAEGSQCETVSLDVQTSDQGECTTKVCALFQAEYSDLTCFHDGLTY